MTRNIWQIGSPYKVYIDFDGLHNDFADWLNDNDLSLMPRPELDSDDGVATFEIVRLDD